MIRKTLTFLALLTAALVMGALFAPLWLAKGVQDTGRRLVRAAA